MIRHIHEHIHTIGDLREEVVGHLYDPALEVHYFEKFTSDASEKPVKKNLSPLGLYYYMLSSISYILQEKNFSLSQASYFALAYNLNDRSVSEKLEEINREFLLYSEFEKLSWSKKIIGRFALIVTIFIGVLALALIPVFIKSRKYIVSIYSVLQELYTFELTFQSQKLE